MPCSTGSRSPRCREYARHQPYPENRHGIRYIRDFIMRAFWPTLRIVLASSGRARRCGYARAIRVGNDGKKHDFRRYRCMRVCAGCKSGMVPNLLKALRIHAGRSRYARVRHRSGEAACPRLPRRARLGAHQWDTCFTPDRRRDGILDRMSTVIARSRSSRSSRNGIVGARQL